MTDESKTDHVVIRIPMAMSQELDSIASSLGITRSILSRALFTIMILFLRSNPIDGIFRRAIELYVKTAEKE